METVELNLLDTRTFVLYNDIKTNGEFIMEVRLLKGKDVAEMLGVSNSFAYLLMKRGDIPTVRIGSAVRVRLEDLENYIKEKATQNEDPFNNRVR